MKRLHVAQPLTVDLRGVEHALRHPHQALPIKLRPFPLRMIQDGSAFRVEQAVGVIVAALSATVGRLESSLPLTACWWMWAAWTMEVVSVSSR